MCIYRAIWLVPWECALRRITGVGRCMRGRAISHVPSCSGHWLIPETTLSFHRSVNPLRRALFYAKGSVAVITLHCLEQTAS